MIADNGSKFAAILVDNRNGRIIETATCVGTALLDLFALKRCTKTRDVIVFNTGSGDVLYKFSFTENGAPPKKSKTKTSVNMDALCINWRDLCTM